MNTAHQWAEQQQATAQSGCWSWDSGTAGERGAVSKCGWGGSLSAGLMRHGHEWPNHKAYPCLCNPLSWLPPFSCIHLSFHGLFPSRVPASGLLVSFLSESSSSSTTSLHISWQWRKWHQELLLPQVWGISGGLWHTTGSSSSLWPSILG